MMRRGQQLPSIREWWYEAEKKADFCLRRLRRRRRWRREGSRVAGLWIERPEDPSRLAEAIDRAAGI